MKRNSKGAFQVSTAPGPGRRRLVLLLQLQLNLKSASVREEHMVWRRMWCEWARARQEERGREGGDILALPNSITLSILG
jgi:hypothetical protein